MHTINRLYPHQILKPYQEKQLSTPSAERLLTIHRGFDEGLSLERVQELTMIDIWFLDNLLELYEFEQELKKIPDLASASESLLLEAKQ